MEPWYKVVQPRIEVREGRSFNPDEFAIALEQVAAETAPEDYTDPNKFFARTCFTQALREHLAMVLRRLNGETVNAAPVLTLITQFGGGKTHTLTALYHAVRNAAAIDASIKADLLRAAETNELPQSRVSVFVGNAWDPTDTRETPWIDVARQLAGDEGVAALGPEARNKPGRELRDRVEELLAWQRVQKEISDGSLGGEFENSELKEVHAKVSTAQSEAREEVWASYRYIVFADPKAGDGLREIDFGAGHSSGAKSLSDRVLGALKSNVLLNESPGAGYLERRWPNAFKETGAWPLRSLRQAFLDGSLDRLISPDEYLKRKIPELVANGDFGLASGDEPGGSFEHLWFKQLVSSDEVSFDPGVYLLKKDRAAALKSGVSEAITNGGGAGVTPIVSGGDEAGVEVPAAKSEAAESRTRTLLLSGSIPPESWNKVGTRLIPKLRSGNQLSVGVTLSVEVGAGEATHLRRELEQILADLNLTGKIKIESR